MALLKTAHKVEKQVQEYRSDNDIDIDQVWASHEQLLVLIEPGYSPEKLIRTAKSMADKGFSKWYVAYVDNGSFAEKSRQQVQKVLKLSELGKVQQQTRLLFEASRQMAAALIVEFLPQLFKVQYALLLPSLDEELRLYPGSTIAEEIDLAIAGWVFNSGQAAGLNTQTFAGSKFYYLPINSQIRTRGVVVLLPEQKLRFFLPSSQDLLTNFSGMIATTLERIHFTQVAIQTEVLLAKSAPGEVKAD